MTEQRTVLVIEDDDILRHAVTFKLSHSGFTILEAKDGQQALDVLGKEKPHVIILDLNMPNMNGLVFLKIYKRNYRAALPETKIIVYSNYSDDEHKNSALDLGADEYLTKADISINQFLELVEKAVPSAG